MRKFFAIGCVAILSCILAQPANGQKKDKPTKEKPTYESMVQRLKSATDQDREKVKSEIEKQLNEEYATYLKARQKPILELKARLDKLQAEFDAKMEAYKEQQKLQTILVQHRLDSIWLQAQGLSWPGQNKSKEIPTKKANKGSSKTGSAPVQKKTQPQSNKTQPVKTSERAIPTSKTFEVYLPGMV